MFFLFVCIISLITTASLYGFNVINYDGRFLLPIAVYLAVFFGVIIVYFLILFFLYAFVNKKKPIKKPSGFHYFVYRTAIEFICNASNVSVRGKGLELLDKNKNYLFVFNHRSNFDPIVVAKILKNHKPLMISKPQNFSKFMVGGCIHKLGFMPIDRDNDREALKTIIKSVNLIKDGYSIGVFPEGTRNKSGEGLLPLKNGAFKIATKAKKPIAVLSILGTEKISKNLPFRRTKVYIEVVKIIEPEEFSETATFNVGEIVEKALLDNINKT